MIVFGLYLGGWIFLFASMAAYQYSAGWLGGLDWSGRLAVVAVVLIAGVAAAAANVVLADGLGAAIVAVAVILFWCLAIYDVSGPAAAVVWAGCAALIVAGIAAALKKRSLKYMTAEQLRALDVLLDKEQSGITQDILRRYGFEPHIVDDLIKYGLVTRRREIVQVGAGMTDVVRITSAGRKLIRVWLRLEPRRGSQM